jgi:lysophospholipid acyltransferase (LPLAT)-like uncharacterized protein
VQASRAQLLGAEPALAEILAGRPLILAFWHERLPVKPALRRLAIAAEPKSAEVVPHGLVSQHHDGRFIGDAVMRLGFRMV